MPKPRIQAGLHLAAIPKPRIQAGTRARFRTAIAILVMTGLGGCSWFQFPGVYKLSVQQGNILTQEMVDQLQPGMTKRQVNYVMGTPLIKDSFNQDRWDYYYSKSDSEGKVRTERLTVFFEEDKLTRFVGDFRPSNFQTAGVQDDDRDRRAQ